MVVEVAVAVGCSSLFFDDEVGGFGLSVGVPRLVVGEDPVFPLVGGPSQPGQLGDVCLVDPLVEEVEGPASCCDVAGLVDVTEQFFAPPGASDLIPTVTVGVVQRGGDPLLLVVSEPFTPSEKEMSDPVPGGGVESFV